MVNSTTERGFLERPGNVSRWRAPSLFLSRPLEMEQVALLERVGAGKAFATVPAEVLHLQGAAAAAAAGLQALRVGGEAGNLSEGGKDSSPSLLSQPRRVSPHGAGEEAFLPSICASLQSIINGFAHLVLVECVGERPRDVILEHVSCMQTIPAS